MKKNFEIETFEELVSTNDYIKDNPELWKNNFYTVRAIKQTAGRGRQNREWFSFDKLDLTFSTLFYTDLKHTEHSIISFYIGLAAYRALNKYCDEKLSLKWPNDIYYEERKLCGILCESILSDNINIVIAGVGVNVNSTEFPVEIKKICTSIKKITGKNYEIDHILYDILEKIYDIIPSMTSPIKKDILNEWHKAFRLSGTQIKYYSDGKERNGKIDRLHHSGNIIIFDSETNKKIIYNGDIIYL